MDKISYANFDPIDIANFWMHVKKVVSKTAFSVAHGQCWEWQGALFSSGYGHFVCHQKSYRAHRVAYYLFNGKIAKEMFICHCCDNPKCVNPNHLFEGTPKDNTKDRDKKKRTVKSKSKRKGSSSPYYGVTYRKDNGKWRARYMLNYKNVLIGQFDTELEAANAYDNVVSKLNETLGESDKFKMNFTS